MDSPRVYYKLHTHLPRGFGQSDPRRYLEVYVEKLMEVDKPSLFEVRNYRSLLREDFLASSKFSFVIIVVIIIIVSLLLILGRTRGGVFPKVFLIFFLDDKTSAPEVFCSCSFISRADFETK